MKWGLMAWVDGSAPRPSPIPRGQWLKAIETAPWVWYPDAPREPRDEVFIEGQALAHTPERWGDG